MLIFMLMLAGAIACYAIGSIKGLGLFIIVGALFELGFWLGLLKNNKGAKV